LSTSFPNDLSGLRVLCGKASQLPAAGVLVLTGCALFTAELAEDVEMKVNERGLRRFLNELPE
jgi:hypothetical protein